MTYTHIVSPSGNGIIIENNYFAIQINYICVALLTSQRIPASYL